MSALAAVIATEVMPSGNSSLKVTHCSWGMAQHVVTEMFKAGKPVATVWHPDADTDLIPTNWGSARVHVDGEARYQLSTGEIIKL